MKSDKGNSSLDLFELTGSLFHYIDPDFVLNRDQFSILQKFIELFSSWNARYSFSKYSTDLDIVGNLIFPSFCHGSIIPQSGMMVDLGSGAGFPGAVIAILKPDLDVTCIDSSESAVEFLVEFLRQFPLSNISVLNGRADELAHENEYRESYDIAIARSFAPVPIVLEIATGFVKPMGRIVLQVAEKAVDEIEHHEQDIGSLSLEKTRHWSFNKPTEDDSERISMFWFCEFRKINRADDRFPRSWRALKKRPMWISDTESD